MLLPSWNVLPSMRDAHLTNAKKIKIGDLLVKHSPLKDPLMIQSSKNYESEPVKQIDWYATAKTGKMQSKVFQNQNLDTFTLMLDLSTPQGNGLYSKFEELIEQAAYITSRLIKEDCKLELFINRLDDENRLDHVFLSEGSKQLRRSLVQLSLINESDRLIASKRFLDMVHSRKHQNSELIKINYSLIL